MDRQVAETDPSVEEIQHQMEKTRMHLAGQVEMLEQDVMAIVHGATTAVNGTIEEAIHLEHEISGVVHDTTVAVAATIKSAKESMGETVETVQEAVKETMNSVKHALDVGEHVRRRPWLMLAGAVALGYICSVYLLPRR